MDAIVFGTGNYYKTKQKSVQENYNVIAYLDNSVKPNETVHYSDGKIILNPKQLDALPSVPVLLMSAKFMDMYEQLSELGVDSQRIVFGTIFKPAYDPFEEMLEEYSGKLMSSNKMVILKITDKEYAFHTAEELRTAIREVYRDNKSEVNIITQLPMTPMSRRYGREHGTPIDRYYIEKFINDNRNKIKGDIAEFADDTYTKRFGSHINHNYILHINGWGDNVIKADLVTGEGIEENKLDCLICTQVIQFIYEINEAISNIRRLLKKGGYALITAHGISQLSLYDYRNWGEYWRFTEMSLKGLFAKHFGEQSVKVVSYGNVKIATAMMYGLAVEDLSEDIFNYNDVQYPVVLGVVVRKA